MTIDLKDIILSILSFIGVTAMGLLAFFGRKTYDQIIEQDKRLRNIEGDYVRNNELTGAINRVNDSIEKHNDKMEEHINRIETEVRGDLKDMSQTISGLTAAIIKKGNRSGSITDD